ncbi:MAG: amidohydrolase family protein [Gemmatimonadota bacterium]|nr:amidohydrolase family protein [Gemmatimonadota bacterium]
MTRRAFRTVGLAAVAVAALLLPADRAEAQDLAIVGATVHPVSGSEIENATVLVVDGRIEAVGTGVAVPEGIRRIDGAGTIVTPGLFDPVSQIGLVEVDLVRQTRDQRLADSDDPITAAFDPSVALNPWSTLIPYARAGGLTTVATGPTGGLVAGQAAVIDLAGETPEEMLAKPRAAMRASYGESGAAWAGGARGGAILRMREILEDARFWRANRSAFDRGQSRELAQSRLDLEALQPVLDGTMPLVVQAHRSSDILAVLGLAREFGIRPVILGGSEAWMVADRLAEAGVAVILKPLSSLPGDFEELGARFDNAAILHEAGVPIAFTTFENHRAKEITQEAGNAVRFGLPWETALEAITLAPAEIYGVADRYGSIEPGKVANLVVWNGDPLELSSYPEAVVIRGRVQPENSRQKALLERYRHLDDTARPAYDGSR